MSDVDKIDATVSALAGLTEGRIVRYTMTGEEPGILGHTGTQQRPAMVVHVHPEGGFEYGEPYPMEGGTVNLQVFLNTPYDRVNGMIDPTLPGTLFLDRIPFTEEPTPGKWHWTPQA